MNGADVLRSAFTGVHTWYLDIVVDVGTEQANTVPPGVAHPVDSLIAHIL